MEKIKNINDLLVQQVRNIYNAEKYLMDGTLSELQTAEYIELKEFLMIQQEEKHRQLSRLGEVCKHLGVEPEGELNEPIRCLAAQLTSSLQRTESPTMKDTLLAIFHRSMIDLQINAYQTAVSCAVEINDADSIRLLRRCLREEKGLEKHIGLIEEVCIEDLGNTPVVEPSPKDKYPM